MARSSQHGRQSRRTSARDTTRTNESIRAKTVRLIDDNGQQIGVVHIREALRLAADRELDLVEIASQADPPVCRLLNYSRYRYEQDRKAK
jgi:translation initiation factor IF-3